MKKCLSSKCVSSVAQDFSPANVAGLKTCATFFLLLAVCFLFQPAFGGEINQGEQLLSQGKLEPAAKWFAEFISKNPKDSKKTPEALINLGTTLEKMSDIINTKAERQCFRSGAPKGTACMNAFAEKFNAEYGAGSFEYLEQMVFINYTGVHYKKVTDEFSKTPFDAQAGYLLLTKKLKGHPDVVLPRIKEFLSKYKDGEWHRKGLLLWARVNEDVWWIHRKWSWVLYNWQVSPEELIVKAEPYRQEALRTFQDIIKKHGNTDEGSAAKGEYELLKRYETDGKLYGIVNESDVDGTKALPGHELVK